MAKTTREKAGPATDWDRLEGALTASTARRKPGPAVARELEGFDDAELAVLRRLATRGRLSRSRSAARGNVVFLHGITGADLETVSGDDRDQIWINLARLMLGRIERLKLSPDASDEADKKYRVVATRPNRRYYARAMLSLRARWNAEPFAYDWRKGIDTASDGLARFIRARFPGQPVHIVAHSMGGLVARNMIRRDPQLWEAMQDPEGAAGGRLVMLGTPNYGSFAIVQAMTGADQMMTLLEKCDLKHDMSGLLAITNTFLGSYQLLPAPSKLPATLEALYQADTWPRDAHISQAHLNRAFAFHAALASAATVSATRMVYVAGCGRPTIAGMTIAGPGDFEYVLSQDGDGRVPHALGLLPGVPTYYVDEVHGDLARNEDVLRALDDFLESGTTSVLGTSVLRGVTRGTPSMRDYHTATDRLLMNELERIAQLAQERGDPAQLSRADLHLGDDALIRASLGSGRGSRPTVPVKPREAVSNAARKVSVRVAPKLSDVCDVKAPAVVVGHYRGMAPANALGAVDRRLHGWISLAVKRGMIGGSLGETFFVPTSGLMAADAVVVAGMGTPGTFTEDGLQTLMTNVAMGAGALGLKSFATLLVGAGEGNLAPDRVLRALLNGVAEGLLSLPDETGESTSLQEVVIVEHNPDRFLKLVDDLKALTKDERLRVRLEVKEPRATEIRRAQRLRAARPAAPARAPQAPATRSAPADEVRLTLESPDGGKGKFRFSAITRTAVVPVRDVDVSPAVFGGLAAALQRSESGKEQEQYGRLLFDYLIPEDFDEVIGDAGSVRLIVDRATASFPWEMACFRSRSDSGGARWLGLDRALTRQFRTMLSRPPGATPPLNEQVRVLVIADPAPEPELQLPYARREGRHVVETLRRLNRPELRIDVESRIGSGECDIVEVLALILTGGFDIVHYAGHGDYDPADPMTAGWIFGRDQVVTARDIFRARRVPRLVFANACFSGAIYGGAAHDTLELSHGLATIAQAFFERGVPNYLGSGWPVNDAQAATFAGEFYKGVLGARTLREAISAARGTIYAEARGSTWGAYQLYGNPDDVVVRLGKPRAAAAPGRASGTRSRRRTRPSG